MFFVICGRQFMKYSRSYTGNLALIAALAASTLYMTIAPSRAFQGDGPIVFSEPAAETDNDSSCSDGDNAAYSLADLMALAIQHHPELRGSKFDLEAAEAKLRQAKSVFVPDISWSATSNRTHNKAMKTTTDINAFEWTATLPVWTGGSMRTGRDMARLGREITEEKARLTYQGILFNVVESYFNALRARDGLEVAREGLRLIQTHHKLAISRYEAGVALQSDVLRAEVQLASMEENVIRAGVGFEMAMEALGLAVGKTLATDSLLKSVEYDPAAVIRAESEDTPAIPDIEYFAKAMQESPAMILNNHSVSMAYHGIRMARSGCRPNVVVQGSVTDADNRWPPRTDGRSWSVALRTSYTLFDGGNTSGRINEAEAAWQKAKTDFENSVNGLMVRLRSSRLALKAADATKDATIKGLSSARENLRLTESRYNAGNALSVEILDDQLNLVKALNSEVNARYDYDLAEASLYHAAGLIEKWLEKRM